MRLVDASKILCVLIAVGLTYVQAQDKKNKDEPKKPQPPRVTVALPLGLVPGTTNALKIRGLELTNVTEFRFADPKPPYALTIKSKNNAKPPPGLEASKAGDTQLELEVVVPPDAPPGSNAFVVANPEGDSPLFWLMTAPANSLIEEVEPNPGFKRSQEIPVGKLIRGSIQEANDVDVFSFAGKAGQKVRIETQAARWGAALDSILTLYDSRAYVVVVNDDSEAKTDSVIRATLPSSGQYFISVQDAHDRGGPLHVYLLSVNAD